MSIAAQGIAGLFAVLRSGIVCASSLDSCPHPSKRISLDCLHRSTCCARRTARRPLITRSNLAWKQEANRTNCPALSQLGQLVRNWLAWAKSGGQNAVKVSKAERESSKRGRGIFLPKLEKVSTAPPCSDLVFAENALRGLLHPDMQSK